MGCVVNILPVIVTVLRYITIHQILDKHVQRASRGFTEVSSDLLLSSEHAPTF
jgi:hypothetical protein